LRVYCYGIRPERRLCEEVNLNLDYRWFCHLGLGGKVADHSTFSEKSHGRFHDSDALRPLFEVVLKDCLALPAILQSALEKHHGFRSAHADTGSRSASFNGILEIKSTTVLCKYIRLLTRSPLSGSPMRG
jgi:hypothetical protein